MTHDFWTAVLNLTSALFGTKAKTNKLVAFSCTDGTCPRYAAALRIVHPITSYFVKDNFEKLHDTLFRWSQGLSDQHMEYHMLDWLDSARKNNVRHQKNALRQLSTDELVKQFNPPKL